MNRLCPMVDVYELRRNNNASKCEKRRARSCCRKQEPCTLCTTCIPCEVKIKKINPPCNLPNCHQPLKCNCCHPPKCRCCRCRRDTPKVQEPPPPPPPSPPPKQSPPPPSSPPSPTQPPPPPPPPPPSPPPPPPPKSPTPTPEPTPDPTPEPTPVSSPTPTIEAVVPEKVSCDCCTCCVTPCCQSCKSCILDSEGKSALKNLLKILGKNRNIDNQDKHRCTESLIRCLGEKSRCCGDKFKCSETKPACCDEKPRCSREKRKCNEKSGCCEMKQKCCEEKPTCCGEKPRCRKPSCCEQKPKCHSKCCGTCSTYVEVHVLQKSENCKAPRKQTCQDKFQICDKRPCCGTSVNEISSVSCGKNETSCASLLSSGGIYEICSEMCVTAFNHWRNKKLLVNSEATQYLPYLMITFIVLYNLYKYFVKNFRIGF